MTLPSRDYFIGQAVLNAGFSKHHLSFMSRTGYVPQIWVDVVVEQFNRLNEKWAEISYAK